MEPKIALQKAVEFLGGQNGASRALNCPQSYVWYWLHRASKLPAERAIEFENATRGQIGRHQLRPDIWPKAVKK